MPSKRKERRDRLTVLHLAQPVEGGVARVVTDLVGAQTQEGVRVVVACPEGGMLSRQAAAAGAEVEHWPAVREPGPRVPAETRRAYQLIRRVGPHIVHAHSAKAGLAARLALRGRVPTVYQPHAWSFEAVEGHTARLARNWERWAARWTDRLLCVSEAERLTGEQAGITAPWTVVHNGVDVSGSEWRGADARASARAGLPMLDAVPADAPLVVCVGRLCPQKGQRTLLDAWPRITAQVPGARLVLVGDGPDRARLSEEAPDGVLFAGASDQVNRWYAAADLAVLPSLWEGMALTPLEAMACGRPVVVTDVGGARECLPPGQEEVCLVRADDPPALATAVTNLLKDPELRAYLGEAARKHVHADFDVRQTAASVLRLYRELLGTPSTSGSEQATR
ncbi:MAG TPA: glycosyltransferase family 4 protein [Streptomyces sp.]|nr:glycosyltransferase family 4 protein [Streptomyces sp.]